MAAKAADPSRAKAAYDGLELFKLGHNGVGKTDVTEHSFHFAGEGMATFDLHVPIVSIKPWQLLDEKHLKLGQQAALSIVRG